MPEPSPMTGAVPGTGDEVDPLTEQLARVEEENRALTAQMTHALRLGDELLEEARLEADSLVGDAHEQAAKLMLEAEDEVDRLVGQARREASTALAAEQARIDQLAAEVETRERHAAALLEQTREERRAMEAERARLAAELRDLVGRFMDVATPIVEVRSSTPEVGEAPADGPVEVAPDPAPARVESDAAMVASAPDVAAAEMPTAAPTEAPVPQTVDSATSPVPSPVGWEPIDASELTVTGFFSPDAELGHEVSPAPPATPTGPMVDDRLDTSRVPAGSPPPDSWTGPDVEDQAAAPVRDLFERPGERSERADHATGDSSLADHRLFDSPSRGDGDRDESVRPVPQTLAEWGLGPDVEVDDHAFDAFFSSDVEDEPSRSWMLDVER